MPNWVALGQTADSDLDVVDMADAPETCYPLPSCVTIPNFVVLGQTIWAYIGVPKIWYAGPAP